MARPAVDQLVPDSDLVMREWDALQKDDLDAVHEHLAKLHLLAVYLNARVIAPTMPEA